MVRIFRDQTLHICLARLVCSYSLEHLLCISNMFLYDSVPESWCDGNSDLLLNNLSIIIQYGFAVAYVLVDQKWSNAKELLLSQHVICTTIFCILGLPRTDQIFHITDSAWVGNLKQRVPLTSKFSKFKGEKQHYLAKFPKFIGVKHFYPKMAPVLTQALTKFWGLVCQIS